MASHFDKRESAAETAQRIRNAESRLFDQRNKAPRFAVGDRVKRNAPIFAIDEMIVTLGKPSDEEIIVKVQRIENGGDWYWHYATNLTAWFQSLDLEPWGV